MERQVILDKIEEIQDYCEENNIGLNEERLETREMIADYIGVIVSELKTSDESVKLCDLCGKEPVQAYDVFLKLDICKKCRTKSQT